MDGLGSRREHISCSPLHVCGDHVQVRLVNTGAVLHSKARGQGRCETDAEVDAVVAQLSEWMAASGPGAPYDASE